MSNRTQAISTPESKAVVSVSDVEELRCMLAFSYSGQNLYCDDGELQDSSEHPFIDFRRDSVAEIKDKMEQRGLNILRRYFKPPNP